jgi:hypothetical protein
MPVNEINFQNTVIYKIQHIEKEDLIYVGHTTDFTKRKYLHKYHSSKESSKKSSVKVYEMIRSNGGWEMFKMLEVKKFPCNDKREAMAEEDKVMKELKATMNAICAVYDVEKHRETQKKCNIEYNKEHKDELLKYWKDYRVKNIDQINARTKEIVQCECGVFVTRKAKGSTRHIQSQKHKDGMKSFSPHICKPSNNMQ